MARPKSTYKGKRYSGSLQNSATHLRRYTLHHLGQTPQEIAQREGVSVKVVERSIRTMDAFRAANSVEFLNANLVDTVVTVKTDLDKAIKNGLNAKVIGKDGMMVPNHDIQLKAVEQVREIAKAIQPKAPGNRTVIAPVMNQQTAVAPPTSESRFMGFEERLRKIRSDVDAHNQLPPPASIAAPVGDDELSLDEEDVSVEPVNTEG